MKLLRRRRIHMFLASCRGIIKGAKLIVKILINYCKGYDTKYVVLLEHLGDIIACEPLLPILKAQHPKTNIYWCLRSNYSEILHGNPYLNGIIEIGCITEWIFAKKFLDKSKFIELHIKGRECPVCRIPLMVEHSNKDITLDNYYNFGPILISFTRANHIDVPLESQPQLYISVTRPLEKNYIVAHRTSNEQSRNWKDSEWVKVFEFINSKTNYTIIDIGDKELTSPYKHPRYLSLISKTNLKDVASYISNSSFFIGIDSSLAHFANVYQKKSLILIGHYRIFRNYLPYTGYLYKNKEKFIFHFDGELSSLKAINVIERLQVIFDETL